MTRDELLDGMSRGIGGVYGLGSGWVVVWVDEHCKTSKPILRGEGPTLDDALANMKAMPK